MDNLNTILEKVLTLNVNANTNIDVQSIIEKYVLYTNLSKVLITLFISLGVIIIVAMILRTVKKTTETGYILKAGKEIKDNLDDLKNWDGLRTVDRLEGKIDEVLAYVPRNKTKRKGD